MSGRKRNQYVVIAVHSIRDLDVLHGLKTSTLVVLRGNNCSDAVSETRKQRGNRPELWNGAVAFRSGWMKRGICLVLLVLLLLSFAAAGLQWMRPLWHRLSYLRIAMLVSNLTYGCFEGVIRQRFSVWACFATRMGFRPSLSIPSPVTTTRSARVSSMPSNTSPFFPFASGIESHCPARTVKSTDVMMTRLAKWSVLLPARRPLMRFRFTCTI